MLESARSISELGFKRWYERQLIEAHAWLVSCVLCIIAIAASFEVISFRESATGAIVTAAFMFVAGMICWHALQRYGAIMVEAERLAERSTCPGCRAYAAFQVIDPYPVMKVRCRKCGREWQIE